MSLRPLAGVKVVEVGSSVASAFGARLLADLGAEVIKVEPAEGDAQRRVGPFLPSGASALFGHLHHGKRSVMLDHHSEHGARALTDLARNCDVLIWAQDGHPASTCPASLLDRNAPATPAVILLSPFGQSGARSGWAGSEYIAQYSGGYAYHQACPVSDPEATPPTGCADREAAMLCGLVVANAALWALTMPDDAPKPVIDLSAEDVFAAMLIDPLADYHRGTQLPGRAREPGRSITIAGGLVWLLPCADGMILVSPREDHQWQRWIALMGTPAWAADAALCGSRETRTKNAPALQKLMAVWSIGETARSVFERAQAARVACFPVSTAEDLLSNPQLRNRRFFNKLSDGDGTEAVMPGLPFAMRSSGGATLPRGLTVACAPPGEISAPRIAAALARGGHTNSGTLATLPLTGIRVVDFSWVMAGPMATKMLGSMGAEIIKIESTTRPEFSFREAWFAVINNNKKSCTLDITTPDAQAILHDLVATSDVVVENFSSRVLAKNNLAYQHLAKIKPDIIFVSASGLGRTGPERDLLAYGSLLQAYSGRVGMMGRMNPELEAMGVMPAWTDPVTALWETMAVLAALRHRRETGEGCYIDLSMLEATVALLPDAILRAGLGQPQRDKADRGEPGAAPSGCFRCAGADDWLALSIHTDQQWRVLCTVLRQDKLAQRKTLITAAGRRAASTELNEIVAAWCRGISATEAEALLQARAIPATRVRGIHDLVQDAHLGERGAFRQLDDGSWTTTLPWMADGGWRGHYSPTPPLGSHNGYVLGDILGLSAERQEELKSSGVIR
jgi:crotonobetainyl-CoA:carnitine CoA-transferase CaiB-like acyl-CoA transferase